MKKISMLLCLTLMAALTLTGCGSSGSGQSATPPVDASSAGQEAAPQESAPQESTPAAGGLEGKTKLVMATEAGFAPYEYYDDSGKVVGVDPDIANAIAEALGLELEIEEMDFDAIVFEVQSGRVDFGAAGLTITEERQRSVDFSTPYATSKQIIMVLTDNDEINGPDDLAGKSVGVQMGTVADWELTDEYPDTDVQRYKRYFEAVADLQAKRLDAIVMDVLPAQNFLLQNDDLKIVDEELMTDEYALCVQKGNTELLDAINGVLEELISSGKVDEFTLKHTVS